MQPYFAEVTTKPGLNSLPFNPCHLLDFNLLLLGADGRHEADTGGREVLAVVLGGQVTIAAAGRQFERVGGRPNVFAGKPASAYLPAGVGYTISAYGPAEVALVSAPAAMRIDPYIITPAQVAGGVWGAANFRRHYHQILTPASQPDLPAQRLIVGETYTPSGNWSTYPPHKHEADDLPGEAFHEEMYFFKVNPADGFGLARFYDDKGLDVNYTVRDNTILMIPHGYHTVVSAPGYTTYYLWFLAGEHRLQAVAEDAALRWVTRTVPMLRELGH